MVVVKANKMAVARQWRAEEEVHSKFRGKGFGSRQLFIR